MEQLEGRKGQPMKSLPVTVKIVSTLGLLALCAACAPTIYLPTVSRPVSSSVPHSQEASLEMGRYKVALAVDPVSYRAGGYRLSDYPKGLSAVAHQACTNTGLCEEVALFSSLDQARAENQQRLDAGGSDFDFYIVIKPCKTSFRAGFHPAMIGPQLLLFPVIEPFLPAPIHIRFAVADVNWRIEAYDKKGLLIDEKTERWRKKKTFAKNCYYSGVCMSWAMRPLVNQLAVYIDEETGAFLRKTAESISAAPNGGLPPL